MIKVKLLDSNLIRCFGGSIIDMNDGQAQKYISMKKAIPVEKNKAKSERFFGSNKVMDAPLVDKAVWIPPEKKMFKEEMPVLNKIVEIINFPKPEDPLFAQIIS